MKRRDLLAAAAALPLLSLASALPAAAAVVPLDQLSAYVNSLVSVQARFVQTNADGSTQAGTVSIRRPNRARFEYDPPDKALVLASAGQVAVFDSYKGGNVQMYPLRATPLKLILAANVDLSTAGMVVAHKASGERTLVVAQDPEHPEYGQIGLYFEANPVRLAEWIVSDSTGQQTRVKLDPFKTVADLPASMFSITMEKQKRGL